MDDERSRPTDAAKQHDSPLGAPPMPGPQQAGSLQPPPPQGHVIQPNMQQPGMVYQPPGYPPPQGYPQQPIPGQPVPQQFQQPSPGRGVPMQQFVQQGQAALGPNGQMPPRPAQAVQGDLRALNEAVQREAEKRAATPPEDAAPIEVGVTASEQEGDGEEKEDENLFLGSMDAEMDAAIDKFNNSRRRKRIEAKLKPMMVESMVEHGELRQKVRISAGIVVEFRTTRGDENQAILHELGTVDGSELFLRERLALMNLAAGLRMVGSELMPPHFDANDEFDSDLFEKKLKRVLRFPIQILADMRVNYFWFDDRVRNVMIADELGNG